MTCPNDGVAFPVAKGLAGLDGGRTLVDINACGNEMGTGMRGSRSGPLAKLAQEQAYLVVVAGLDFAAEQFIDPRGGQFNLGIHGAMGDDVGTFAEPVRRRSYM